MNDKSRHKRKPAPAGHAIGDRQLSDEEADRRAWEIVNKPDQNAGKAGSGKKSRRRLGYNEE